MKIQSWFLVSFKQWCGPSDTTEDAKAIRAECQRHAEVLGGGNVQIDADSPAEAVRKYAEQQRYRQWWPASTMVAVIPVEPSDLDARVPMYSVTTDKNGVKVRYVKRKGVDVSGPIVGKSITQSFIDDVVSHG